MDLSYATIPQPDRTPFILYREPQLPIHVNDLDPFCIPTNGQRLETSVSRLSPLIFPLKKYAS